LKEKKPKGEAAGGKNDESKSKATHDGLTREEPMGAKRKRTSREDELGAKDTDAEPATTAVDSIFESSSPSQKHSNIGVLPTGD
ncbi:hypothetical protein FIBSPDRAFT_879875, partial [Athelia psychrophila]